jgi:HEAT repeat protein
MPITIQQVLARLDVDEPDYPALATLGPEAVPHLNVLARSDNPGIAAKAVYLASLIESDESADVLKAASASQHDIVRVAAAAALRNLTPAQAKPMIERLLDDKDVGVRKQALQAVVALEMSGLERKVKKIATRDPEKALQRIAKQGLERLSEIRHAPKEAKSRKPKSAKRAARRQAKRGKK